MTPVSASELAHWMGQADAASTQIPQLLDVREQWEFDTCHLPGTHHIPMREIGERIGELIADRPVVCICHHGGRSAQVAMYLESHGVQKVFNLTGGLDRWSREIDPNFPRY